MPGTWVFSWSAGSPPGTASGSGCAARRPMRRAPVRLPRSTYRRRCSRGQPRLGQQRREAGGYGPCPSPQCQTRQRGRCAGGCRGRTLVSAEPATQNASAGSGPPVTLLPRRNPGSTGITEVPVQPAEQQPRRHRRELPTPWWESGGQNPPAPEPKPAPAQTARTASNTSAFFAARSREADKSEPSRASPAASASSPSIPAAPKGPTGPADDDVIYRRMLAEMLGDPHDLANSPDLDWQSVWDRGWTLAAEAEDKPVESRTADHGLPVRKPGARLVPGAANGTGFSEQDAACRGRA